MIVVDTWTGRSACALQAALRETNESFAARLGVAVRTVAGWHQSPDLVPRTEMQLALDTTYEGASEHVQIRFSRLCRPTAEPAAPQAQALRVAIAVVVRDEQLLLVCRRGDDSISWQFPAGVVKPGGSPATVAVQETLKETGVHCAIREHLGSRVHPVTGVSADYFMAEHLMGEASNLDAMENSDVAWVPRAALTRFIPADRIFDPILSALEAA